MTAAPDHDFVRLSSIETQLGLPIEHRPASTSMERHGGEPRSARTVLEALLCAPLARGTCYVTFSGGRDSSAILALATHVARREGLALPVPVTAVYPDAPASDESRWQQLVLDHLGLREQVVVTIRDEQRLLGRSAVRVLRRRGLVWPEATQLQSPLLSGLEPGSSLVSGEGGDNVITGGRAAPVRHVLRSWPPRRRALRGAALALDPRRRAPAVPAWYSAAAADLCRSAFTSREPVRWDRRARAVLDSPAAQVLFPNVRACIADEGLRPLLPFVDVEFITALADEAGPFGVGGRSQIFERLVGDLLPREVVFRRTKASFNETRWGEAERDFAQSWDGTGADARWIDAERLRSEWLQAAPSPASDFLLQMAWVASHRGDVGMAAGEHEDEPDESTDAG